ncbi:MAG TPA: APC family permease [Chitinophagaceae bacterium]|jgi:APA family basic amino acid/polyamine antiporter|nr:APC family permease [Chitinophagaceae bacterium]
MSTKPKLRLFDLTMIVIGLVIGMGIFRTASDAAEAAISPTVFFGAWIAGGFIALFGALTYAEIGSRLPVVGGYYKIFALCYHPSIAFALNCVILISNAASLSAVALIGSSYLSEVVFDEPASDAVKAGIAMSAILLFYGVNLLGLRMSAKTQNVLMIIKIGMLLFLISSIFILPAAEAPAVATAATGGTSVIASLGLALIAVSFTYGGYQQTINFGAEVDDAPRKLPRGILTGIFVIILLYLSVNYAYYNAVGFENLKTTKNIAAIVAGRMLGPTGSFVFSGLLFIAVLAYVNVLLLSNPRVMYAMSEDGILPAMFRKKDERKDVYTVSLTAFTAIAIVVLFFANQFEQILGFSIFLDSMGFAASAATLFILRRRGAGKDERGIFRMKLYPWITIVFILAYLFVAGSIFVNPETRGLAITGIIVFTALLLIYFIVKFLTNRTPS